MKTLDISVGETEAAALRGVSTDTQRRHRRQKIGPRAFKAEGARGYRYRLREIQAEQDAGNTETARRKKQQSVGINNDGPIEEACVDCNNDEERWQRSLGNLAGDAVSLPAYWSREFGDWHEFEITRELALLAEQAAESWKQIASELRQKISPRPQHTRPARVIQSTDKRKNSND